MVSLDSTTLGIGLYTPAEAAFYARLRTQTMNRWICSSNPVVRPQVENHHEKIVTFLDFIQALAIRDIRRHHEVSLQKIREAVNHVETKYGIRFPLARKHTTYLFKRSKPKSSPTDRIDEQKRGSKAESDVDQQYEVIIRLDGKENDDFVQVTGRHKDNYVIKNVMELFMKEVSFDAEGLAARYVAYEMGNLKVVIDPKKSFGEPLVPSGYTAETLWDAVRAEGSIEAAATAYGVDCKEVELAYRYFDFLQGPIA